MIIELQKECGNDCKEQNSAYRETIPSFFKTGEYMKILILLMASIGLLTEAKAANVFEVRTAPVETAFAEAANLELLFDFNHSVAGGLVY